MYSSDLALLYVVRNYYQSYSYSPISISLHVSVCLTLSWWAVWLCKRGWDRGDAGALLYFGLSQENLVVVTNPWWMYNPPWVNTRAGMVTDIHSSDWFFYTGLHAKWQPIAYIVNYLWPGPPPAPYKDVYCIAKPARDKMYHCKTISSCSLTLLLRMICMSITEDHTST
jgi:hypothetical protein